MEYEIIRSGRKTVAIQITADLRIVVRAPLSMRRDDIERFVSEKRAWIEKHLEIMRARSEEREKRKEETPKFTAEEIEKLAAEALNVIPERVKYFAPIVGVDYGRITIRNQVSRWGSCSSKGNLNFNCLLMLAPPKAMDYVVVHELCHRKEMNHSPRFWSEVERVMPDFREGKNWLKTEGVKLIERLRFKEE